MKTDRIIYWLTTAIVCAVMTFSIYMMYTADYVHFGFPEYFKTELTVFKVLGILALLLPAIRGRVKEWAYAGFAIVFISAGIAHFNSGDTTLNAIEPLGFLVILGVSNIYLHKINAKLSIAD